MCITANQRCKGVTLIELLVVLVCIGILAVAALPIYIAQLQKARDVQTKTDIQKIALDLKEYETMHGKYPPDANPGISPVPGIIFPRRGKLFYDFDNFVVGQCHWVKLSSSGDDGIRNDNPQTPGLLGVWLQTKDDLAITLLADGCQ